MQHDLQELAPRRSFPRAMIGRIPDEVGELEHLQYLRMSVTKLGGRIPDTLGAIKGEEASTKRMEVFKYYWCY